MRAMGFDRFHAEMELFRNLAGGFPATKKLEHRSQPLRENSGLRRLELDSETPHPLVLSYLGALLRS
jgi:hypothetical protein